ncbi:GH25 family lysozyme [Nicoliella lavandulae]|uniref:GH25 family lysozyme n=1 Tax=Nicoliella lavandulae TaxID=3082954 RepID=A0ABU8SME3_9LACO
MSSVLVTDHSAYNDSSVSYFKNLASKGVKSAFVKLSEGTGWKSDVAPLQISNAFKSGMKTVGAYHFFHGNGRPEARYFLYWVKRYKLDTTTPLMIDAETPDIGGTSNINEFLDELVKYGYKRVFVYSMQSYFGVRIFPKYLKHDAKLWVANYSGGFSMDNVTLWQFTDNFSGTSTDASRCYFPSTLGLDDKVAKPDKVKIGNKEYLTTGTHFKVTSLGGVNAYKDSQLTKPAGIHRNTGYDVYGKVVYDGKYPRIKTKYGNYYTTRTDLVQRIK